LKSKIHTIIVTVAGFVVLLAGVVMIALPGPAVIVIPIGLGILATRFRWARNLLDRVKEEIRKRRPRREG
jgi:uncharacterized protein (TIGR02611 family)